MASAKLAAVSIFLHQVFFRGKFDQAEFPSAFANIKFVFKLGDSAKVCKLASVFESACHQRMHASRYSVRPHVLQNTEKFIFSKRPWLSIFYQREQQLGGREAAFAK